MNDKDMLTSNDNKQQAKAFRAEAEAFLAAHPDLVKVEILLPRFCGTLMGKWLPADMLPKLADGAVRLPRSTAALDIWGDDVPAVGIALEKGDPDGICMPVPGTLTMVPWASEPTAQVLVTMTDIVTGEDCGYDTRSTLSRLQTRFGQMDLTPVVATELEFYLIDAETTPTGHPQGPMVPGLGERLTGSQVYNMDVIAAFEPLLAEIYDACLIQNIPAETTISEFGPGQFEMNLKHVPSALDAADHCMLFKRVVRNIARKHGMDATFMAKPYAHTTGNGFHVHMSVLDGSGTNIFSGARENEANDTLRHAIGGMIETMRECQILYAPHANSYRRFQPDSYAPTTPCWGYDHRAVAIRVPSAHGPAARFEHRVAGADANPYLVIASILAGTLTGFEKACDPGAPVETLEQLDEMKPLSPIWQEAIARFGASDWAEDQFGHDFHLCYTRSREAEEQIVAATITDFECRSYLRTV
ncbi:glutamate--putrescine ligase [Cohaesibacter sp. ES.047]|uniref:glutamine synthetase family protein n=1 Tax=Cohaesibacter sp. ES.047 TaxID=1798205 RepID=UPI000BBF4B97|nr:glutamine synthetase family protein [Cohaesibacter sp. ES.047]SNY90177.1 glutamate--putrescine ligase [Cohaesibacter sp. ES.047]